MSERAWKRVERRVAEHLGGRRVPVSGRVRGDAPDVDHDLLAIEVKSRRRLPAWLEDAMRQAEASARDGQLPVAVLHQEGRRYDDSLVILRLKAFSNYLKGRSVMMRRERKEQDSDGVAR